MQTNIILQNFKVPSFCVPQILYAFAFYVKGQINLCTFRHPDRGKR
jgi:hypothetical protein